MRIAAALTILGCVLLAVQPGARAATPAASDWPSLNFDAAQSNDNSAEKTVNARNVLKLKVRWTAPIPDVSYPVVAGGRVYVPLLEHHKVHVRALDAANGKPVGRYTKEALGGILVSAGNLYLAGRVLQEIDPANGSRLALIDAAPKAPNGVFVNPLTDDKVVLAGYASGINSRIYTVDPQSNQVLSKLPTTSALGTIASGKIVTSTATGSAFYDESNGKTLSRQPYIGSNWFAGTTLAYMVGSVKKHAATLYAYDGTGRKAWSKVIGPVLATQGSDWPHAVSADALFVQTLKPQVGVEALDALSGNVLWVRQIPFVQKMVMTSDLLLVLTYGLGQPVKLIAIQPKSGKVIGAIVLSTGYYAFGEPNSLMVADGMVFIRAVGPSGSRLVALAPPPGS